MSYNIIKLKKWPFDKDEKAKLIWIGQPFSENKNWKVNVFLNSIKTKKTKKLTIDWPSIHYLSVGKIYSNGVISKSEVDWPSKIIDIDLSEVSFLYNERPWAIQGTIEKDLSRTFTFKKNGKLYIIPCIEIIRGVLGIDAFTLRLLFSMDSVENYFTYEMDKGILKMYFTREYHKNLLQKEMLYHLAWILTNKNILAMFNEITDNYSVGGIKSLHFDLNLLNFNIKARVKENENKIFIQEILELKNKTLNITRIEIEHPMLGSTEASDKPKKRVFITYTNKNNRNIELDTEVDGSTSDVDIIESNRIEHNYDKVPEIIKVGPEKQYKRLMSDENTKKYFHDDKGRRTLADSGGENKLKGLDFVNIRDIEVEGDLEEFMAVIKLLEAKIDIKSIRVQVDSLPISNGGKFCTLNDMVTPRKYAICEIVFWDRRRRTIIEVEREGRTLSMVILKNIVKEDKLDIYIRLLKDLVDNSGSWDNKSFELLRLKSVKVVRCNHIFRKINKTADIIYKKLL